MRVQMFSDQLFKNAFIKSFVTFIYNISIDIFTLLHYIPENVVH